MKNILDDVFEVLSSQPFVKMTRLEISRAVGLRKTPHTVTAIIQLAGSGRIQTERGSRQGLSCWVYWYDPARDSQQTLFTDDVWEELRRKEATDGED